MCPSAVSEVEPYASRGARTVPGGVPPVREAPTRQEDRIESDGNKHWAHAWYFYKDERVIRIAERQGPWILFGADQERSDANAADKLHEALETYFGEGYLATLGKGAVNVTSGSLGILYRDKKLLNCLHPADRAAVVNGMEVMHAEMTMIANSAIADAQSEVTYLAATFVGVRSIEHAAQAIRSASAQFRTLADRGAFRIRGAYRIESLRGRNQQDVFRAFQGSGFTPSEHFAQQL